MFSVSSYHYSLISFYSVFPSWTSCYLNKPPLTRFLWFCSLLPEHVWDAFSRWCPLHTFFFFLINPVCCSPNVNADLIRNCRFSLCVSPLHEMVCEACLLFLTGWCRMMARSACHFPLCVINCVCHWNHRSKYKRGDDQTLSQTFIVFYHKFMSMFL